MLSTVLKWLAARMLQRAPHEVEQLIEDGIELGQFIADADKLEVGQTATAPEITDEVKSKTFRVDVRVTRTA